MLRTSPGEKWPLRPGIERVSPILKSSLRGVEVHGVRYDVPPRMESVSCRIVVDTDEPDRRLDLLHENAGKYGAVFNTIVTRTERPRVLRRKISLYE